MDTIHFIIIAAFFSAVMDTLNFHFDSSIFNIITTNKKYWKLDEAWKNKYEMLTWIPLWLRKTILTPIFSGWHLSKLFFNMCIVAAIVFYSPITDNIIYDALILYVSYNVTFEFWFRILEMRNPITDKELKEDK